MLTALLLCFALTAGASDIPSFDSRFIKEAEFETALLSTSEEYRSCSPQACSLKSPCRSSAKTFRRTLGKSIISAACTMSSWSTAMAS